MWQLIPYAQGFDKHLPNGNAKNKKASQIIDL